MCMLILIKLHAKFKENISFEVSLSYKPLNCIGHICWRAGGALQHIAIAYTKWCHFDEL